MACKILSVIVSKETASDLMDIRAVEKMSMWKQTERRHSDVSGMVPFVKSFWKPLGKQESVELLGKRMESSGGRQVISYWATQWNSSKQSLSILVVVFKLRVLHPDATDIRGCITLCGGAVLGVAGGWGAPLVSTHRTQAAYLPQPSSQPNVSRQFEVWIACGWEPWF